ncbi:hypothetical protein EG328_006108 [Venturia inaequalis]|uniref:Probable 26S proteasome regulatory subunit p27 n=1 Tax=Venturia inaequalis TaxID=5025 RepID=A0A8H3UK64_VENIN|nr:hypothetical protein EG328_006108 [Venturia inaequalis]
MNGHSNGVTTDKLSFNELMAEKARLEGELTSLGAVLESHGVTMQTGLTTFDGFPRADIDVPQIRTTRARIIHLRNDYKALMSRLEVVIQQRFADMASEPAPAATSSPSVPVHSSTPQSAQATSSTPFAKVNAVLSGSPAADSGLQVGDEVTCLGSATWLNHDKLSKVAEIVAQSEGRPIAVSILRGSESQQLTLTPRSNWGGRGGIVAERHSCQQIHDYICNFKDIPASCSDKAIGSFALIPNKHLAGVRQWVLLSLWLFQ